LQVYRRGKKGEGGREGEIMHEWGLEKER